MASAGPTAAQDAVVRGVIVACLAAFGFSLTHAAIKALGPTYSPLQIAFFRSAFAFLPLLPLLIRAGAAGLATRRPVGHALRAAAGLSSMIFLYLALATVPLAEVAAVAFTMPLFVTILSVPLLGEAVGWRRAVAVAVGFAGVLVILRPGSAAAAAGLSTGHLAALASAFLYALAAVAMRQLARTEPTLRTFFWFTTASTFAMALTMPFVWVTPDLRDFLILASVGLVGGLAQYCLVDAYRNAPAAVIAPFDYTQMIWAILLGYALWGEIPLWTTWLGAGIVAASGIYILRREAHLSRQSRR